MRALSIVSGALLLSCGSTVRLNTPAGVTRSERVWVDASRPTPRTTRYAGAPQRTLRTLIWQTETGASRPLLVLAHGFGGLPEKFDAFARSLAAAGIVVAAPAFPLTNENAPGGHEVGFRDVLNQPGDVGFIITQLLAASHTPGDPLDGMINDAAVAVLGHSLGGLTTLALTRKDCCRDTRVRATILVSAVAELIDIFGSDPVAHDGPETLILHGTADPTVPYSTAPLLYDQFEPPRFLVGVTGGGHSEGLESQTEPSITARATMQRATIAFLRAVFDGEGDQLHATLSALAAEGNSVQADFEP